MVFGDQRAEQERGLAASGYSRYRNLEASQRPCREYPGINVAEKAVLVQSKGVR